METINGKKVSGGVAIGKLCLYQRTPKQVVCQDITDIEAEITRYETAKEKAVRQLRLLYEKVLQDAGELNAQIFEIHAMMLEDQSYNQSVYQMIQEQQVNAEYAVAVTGNNFSERFAGMEDEYFRARSVDVKDISERVITILSGRGSKSAVTNEPVVIMSEYFTPSETIQVGKENLLAIVTHMGSVNSHTAILARTMNIPALTGIVPCKEWDGKQVILDGYEGRLIVEPDEDTLSSYRHRLEKDAEYRSLLETLRGQETVTLDGRSIRLHANIGGVADLEAVLKNDAGGIGLFRSEFLYLEKNTFPTEEEQFAAYKQAAETMAGKKVIIRTLDIGADKQADYFGLAQEENPAMGYRAIRICLTRPEIFKTQLKAIFRASAYGNVAVIYPMITSLQEVKQAKAIAEEVMNELAAEGIPTGEVEQGIMIETPAAAVISDILAKEVDFFSIGTNDLTQYALAIDRQNDDLDIFYDAHHEAVLRLIELVVHNGHAAGIWVGICGELGADMDLTRRFLELGVDELSVPPGSILPIRKLVRETSLS